MAGSLSAEVVDVPASGLNLELLRLGVGSLASARAGSGLARARLICSRDFRAKVRFSELLGGQAFPVVDDNSYMLVRTFGQPTDFGEIKYSAKLMEVPRLYCIQNLDCSEVG